jgi:hypothetical protein
MYLIARLIAILSLPEPDWLTHPLSRQPLQVVAAR